MTTKNVEDMTEAELKAAIEKKKAETFERISKDDMVEIIRSFVADRHGLNDAEKKHIEARLTERLLLIKAALGS
jgi:hypothetical protein